MLSDNDNVSGTMTINTISFVTNMDKKKVASTSFRGMTLPFSMLWAIFKSNPPFCKPFTVMNKTNRINRTCSSSIE